VYKISGTSYFSQQTFVANCSSDSKSKPKFANGSKFRKASLETCFSIQFATITCWGFFSFLKKGCSRCTLQSAQVSTEALVALTVPVVLVFVEAGSFTFKYFNSNCQQKQKKVQ
jgi:hypothetical protein